MENKTVQVDPRAALGEVLALAEFWRNRALAFANQALLQADEIARLKVSLDEAAARIAELSDEIRIDAERRETE